MKYLINYADNGYKIGYENDYCALNDELVAYI